MGRRKKEPRNVHRGAIAAAAQALFLYQGIGATSMDDIARASGYSKATLYVYFRDKDELVGYLVGESLKRLGEYLIQAVEAEGEWKERYLRVCASLERYRREFLYYFKTALEEISGDFRGEGPDDGRWQAYLAGEEICSRLGDFFKEGMEAGILREDIQTGPVIIAFWGMLSGLVQTGANKEAYLEGELKISREEFLNQGYELLYQSIAKKGGEKNG